MHSHIDIQMKGRSLELPPDFSMDIEKQNPLFHDNDMFSLPVQIPLEGNREIVKNVEDVNSDIRPVNLEHSPVRIFADGFPLDSGVAVMQEDEEIKDSLSMNVDSALLSFDDLIGDLECRDIPLIDKIQIGEKIGNVRVKAKYSYRVHVTYQDGKKPDDAYGYYNEGESVSGEFEPQALGFSFPAVCQVGNKEVAVENTSKRKNYKNGHVVKVPVKLTDFINVSDPYPTKPYCNARIAYTHYGLDDDGKTTNSIMPMADSNGAYEDHWPFWVLDADRPQSGICFYVMYFLECLFKHLGVSYDLSALSDIADFNHLCFYTTHCKYTTEIAHQGTQPEVYEADDDIPAGKHVGDVKTDAAGNPIYRGYFYAESSAEGMVSRNDYSIQDIIYNNVQKWGQLSNEDFNKALFTDINNWLESRGCGGQMLINYPDPKQVQDFDYKENGVTTKIVVGKNDVSSITIEATVKWARVQANILSMYASSENFPDTTVKSVLESLENAFGIRWNFDYEQKKVTAYLYRDVFRSQEAPIDFLGTVLSMNKMSEKITGVRMQYSAESDKKDQQKNVRKGVKDYDTDYDYIDYPANNTIIDKSYLEITKQRQIENMTCYVDQKTGNAYRFKASRDGLDAGEYHVSLFEVAQFKGVEVGDCSQENNDFVKEFVNEFTPIPFTDVNYRISEALVGNNGKIQTTYKGRDIALENFNGDYSPLLSAFIDEDMEHEFVPQFIDNSLCTPFINLYLSEKLEMVESYDPSKTEDGNSPLQSYDWGMAIAVMRGGGTDATIQTYDYNYDNFGNSRWRTVSGKYALTSDSMDQMGNGYDYNGTLPGDGGGERFSLKIRAYKPFVYKVIDGVTVIKDANDPDVDSTWSIPCDNDIYDQQGKIIQKVRTRGLYDSFMAELGHFLINRKKYRIEVNVTAAQLVDITNHWRNRYRINGKTGWIDKVKYNISAEKGIDNVVLDFYSI